MLADTEAEVARLREVAVAELVLLDLQATLENLLSLGAADSDMDSDPNHQSAISSSCFPTVNSILFVPPDTEGTDGISGLGVDGSLTRKLLKHLGCTGQTITRLADGDVEDQFLDAELPHGVGSFAFGLRYQLA